MRASLMVPAICQMIVDQKIQFVSRLRSIGADDNVVHLDSLVSDVAAAFEIVELQRQGRHLLFYRITNWPEFKPCSTLR